MVLRACDVDLKGTYEGKMGIIADTLRENYFMIALSLAALCLGGFLLYLLVNNIIGIMSTYTRFTKRVDSTVQVNPIADKSDDVINMQIADILGDSESSAAGDDYKPAVAEDATLQEPAPESALIQSKINEIKGMYSTYNKEITKYSRDVQKEEPKDIMDQRILSKDSDVYY